MKGFLSLAFKNIFRKGTRTVLTVLGIAVGVASVILVNIVGDLGTFAFNQELDSLGLTGISVSAKSSSGVILNKSDLDLIRTFDTVENAIPILTQSTDASYGSKEDSATLWGVDSGANQVISIEVIKGRELSKNDVKGYKNVCLVDENLSDALFGRDNTIGKKIKLAVGTTVDSFEIVGITKTGSGILQSIMGDILPSFVYIPYTTMQSITGTTKISEIAVKLNCEEVDTASANIVDTLQREKGTPDSIKAENLAKQRDKLSNLLSIVSTVLWIVGLISLFVAGLGIMTVMLVSVSERTREIGVKKAIGADFSDIMKEFLLEALIISAIGSISGAVIALFIAFLGGEIINMNIPFNIPMLSFVVLLSIVLGGLFGVYPAYKAAKLQPVEALRYE